MSTIFTRGGGASLPPPLSEMVLIDSHGNQYYRTFNGRFRCGVLPGLLQRPGLLQHPGLFQRSCHNRHQRAPHLPHDAPLPICHPQGLVEVRQRRTTRLIW